jgi:hypothetical protein
MSRSMPWKASGRLVKYRDVLSYFQLLSPTVAATLVAEAGSRALGS